jgi:hypothetical protein
MSGDQSLHDRIGFSQIPLGFADRSIDPLRIKLSYLYRRNTAKAQPHRISEYLPPGAKSPSFVRKNESSSK